MCTTMTLAPCGALLPCPSAMKLAATSPATGGDTAGSSIRQTGLRSISCNSCRSTIRSRSRVSAIHNTSSRTRHLSVTAYAEWVLGPSRSVSAPFVATEIDPVTGAMFVRNAWNAAFGSRVTFADLNGAQADWTGDRREFGPTDWTGDRREFIGRNGTLASPAALASATALSKTAGAGLDPCGALRTTIELPPHGTVEVVFFLGQAASAEDARSLIARYRTTNLDTVLSDVGRYWEDVLGAVRVKTPDRPMDIMLNGWLLYQTLACRMWARSAFYQASGAYGFRDQLQDGTALAASRPEITREHLLRAAARQFVEGDVQHWWLPAVGAGRAHADLRRPSMARLRYRPLYRRDWRRRCSG